MACGACVCVCVCVWVGVLTNDSSAGQRVLLHQLKLHGLWDRASEGCGFTLQNWGHNLILGARQLPRPEQAPIPHHHPGHGNARRAALRRLWRHGRVHADRKQILSRYRLHFVFPTQVLNCNRVERH